MKTLRLKNADVLAIVDALTEFEYEGALSLHVLAPLVERYEAIRSEERAAIRTEYQALRARLAVGAVAGGYQIETMIRDLRTTAHTLANALGHVTMFQGNSCECPRCGASGAAHDDLVGDIFIRRCGPC